VVGKINEERKNKWLQFCQHSGRNQHTGEKESSKEKEEGGEFNENISEPSLLESELAPTKVTSTAPKEFNFQVQHFFHRLINRNGNIHVKSIAQQRI